MFVVLSALTVTVNDPLLCTRLKDPLVAENLLLVKFCVVAILQYNVQSGIAQVTKLMVAGLPSSTLEGTCRVAEATALNPGPAGL